MSDPGNRHGNLSRFRALAGAVREHHRATVERGGILARDVRLYGRLEEIEGSLPLRDSDPSRRSGGRGPIRAD